MPKMAQKRLMRKVFIASLDSGKVTAFKAILFRRHFRIKAHPDTAACFAGWGWSAAVSQTSRSAYFVSIALRASNVLRLGFATAALR
jgi:hypothetical protein